MSKSTERLLALLDIAIWGFEGEPRRCSRCNCDEGDEHSPTCPIPDEVLRPLASVLTDLSRGRVTDRRLDQRLRKPAAEPVTADPEP